MANKKITELPYIVELTGSVLQPIPDPNTYSVVPVVLYGTTNQITVENLGKFITAYSATTASNHFKADQFITGSLTVTGKITAEEFHTEITSASIIYQSGSSKFGDSAEDVMTVTGTILLNGSAIGLQQLNEFTASQIGKDGTLALVTSSLNAFTSSQINKDGTLALVTSSLNAFTSSQIGKDGTLAQVTSSLRYFYQTTSSLHAFTGSQINKDFTLSVVTSSINEFSSSQLDNDVRMLYITGALNSFTQSQIGKDGTLAEVTSSLRYFYQTTSSLHAFTASQIGKDGTLAEVTTSLQYFYQTTSSLHAFTASQINKDGTLALVTSSLNAFTQSQIGKDGTLAVVTSSLNAFTSSQINKDFTLSVVTSSLNNYTSSAIGQANTISAFTSSINAFTGSQINKDFTLSVVTSSLNAFTSSQIGKDGTLAIVTSSFRNEIGGIEAYTASLKSAIIVNGTNVQIVGELDVARLNVQYVSSSVLVTSGSNVFGDASNDKHEFTGSVNIADTLFIKGVAQGTGELNAQTASQQNVNGQIGIATGSLNAFTGSQINKDFTLSVVTSSIDAHILKQATQTGSQDLVNLGISTYTGSQNVINSSVDSHILKQATQTGSQDLVNLGISTYTGSQNVINTSIDAHILKQATQTGSQDLVNLGISTFTGSLRSEVNLIEAYTASLKGQAIVSSSQQVQNYNLFAQTSSANTFYGTQTISGDIKAISNTGSNLKYVQLGTAVNGTGGGNRGFDGSFTGTTTSFIGVDAADQGYGYFPATIINGNTYTLFFKSVETNGTLGTIITSNGTNFATDLVQTLTLPSVTNGVYNTVTFTASASATHIGFAGYPTTGTITLTISEVSLVDGIADANLGKLIVQRSLVSNGDSMFNGNVTASGNLHANQLYIGGATTASGLFGASEAVVQNELGIQFGDATGTYMRLIANTANSNTAIVAGAFSGAQPPLDLITGGVTAISVKNDGGVDFVGSPTASIFKIKTAGGGIDFSITSNGSGTTTSELLNDYEEGTWTPQIYYQNATDQANSTNVTQVGTYTKIGRQVTVSGVLQWTITGSPAVDNIGIKNLPFTSLNSSDYFANGVLQLINADTYPSPPVFTQIQSNSTITEFYGLAGGNNLGSSIGSSGTKTARFSLTYFV